MNIKRMALPAGFEPAISTVRGWHPGPLDDESVEYIYPSMDSNHEPTA